MNFFITTAPLGSSLFIFMKPELATHQCLHFCNNPRCSLFMVIRHIRHHLLATKWQGVVLHPNQIILKTFMPLSYLFAYNKPPLEKDVLSSGPLIPVKEHFHCQINAPHAGILCLLFALLTGIQHYRKLSPYLTWRLSTQPFRS